MNPLAPYVQIREALEEAEAAIHDWTLGSERPRDNEFVYMRASIEYRAGTLAKLKAALQALEAQEAGMTDEEMDSLADYELRETGKKEWSLYGPDKYARAVAVFRNSLAPGPLTTEIRIAIKEALRKVRNQGYRLPAGEPVAWTTALALDVMKSNEGTPFGTIEAASKNLWGERGVPLYRLPKGRASNEEIIKAGDLVWEEVRAEVLHNADGHTNEIVNWCLGVLDDLLERQLSVRAKAGGGQATK